MANKSARLGDLATYINGYAFKPADWGDTGLPIIRIQDLTGNSYQLNRYDGEYPERIEVNDGDVLISWSASLGVYVWQRGKALLNQHIFKVVFDKLPVNKDYFVFAVEQKLAEMESKTHGATMKHIVKKDFDGTTIPYPPIEKQAEIADHLRRITSLIDRQTEQLLLLDQLVKSRFIELFGDVVRNSKEWPMRMFADIASSRLGKMLDAKQQTGKCAYPYLANFNVQWFRFNTENLNQMDFDEDDRAEFELKDGDLLVCEGGEIGRCAVWHNEIQPCFFQKALHRVRCNRQMIHPDYLAWWFRYNCDHAGFAAIAGAKATIAHLPGIKLRQLQVATPPLELQEQFATFVEQTDKSKLCGKMEVAA